MTREYSIACAEVLEVLNNLPQEEREKIPVEEIEFYEENKAEDYAFRYDVNKPVEEQGLSKLTNAIIITIYRDYFANEEQRFLLTEILKENVNKIENQRREKYGNKKKAVKENSIQNNKKTEIPKPAVIKKKNIFQKIWNLIKGAFKK